MKLVATAKDKLKKQVKTRLSKRIVCMEALIKETMGLETKTASVSKRFEISETTTESICKNLLNKINTYIGPKNSHTQQQKNVHDHARKWWNRQKASPFGSFVFAEIIFHQLPQFISSECSMLSRLEQLILFIKIFQVLITHEIDFPKTKAKPLLLKSSFYADSSFKTFCFEFIKIFGDESIQWDPYVKMVSVVVQNGKRTWQYQKNQNRCHIICNNFKKCLDQILSKCKSTNKINILSFNAWDRICGCNCQIQSQTSETTPENDTPELSAECTVTVSKDYTWNSYTVSANNAFWFPYYSNCDQCLQCASDRIFQSTNNFAKNTNRIHIANRIKYNANNNTMNERLQKHINDMKQLNK